MSTFLLDLRHSLRSLRRSPGFTVVAALTLALGIGINTTIFSGISALLLRPLPFANAGQLVVVQPVGPTSPATKGLLVELRARLRGVDAIASYNLWTFTLRGDGAPERMTAARVTGNLFDVLGAPPLLGRTLLPSDSDSGAEPVVVLSYGAWQRRFGGDLDVVGRTLDVNQGGSNGGPTRVVGVMPKSFAFPTTTAEMWAANRVDPAEADFNTGYLELLGRLRPGVSAVDAEREVTATVAAFCAEQPGCNRSLLANARVLPLREALVGPVRPILLLLLGAVGFVLLIACANVANLLLTRAAARERELAIRAALGAGRMRVARQLLTESLTIAAIGGGIGLLAATWGTGVLRSALPGNLVGTADIRIDLRVLAFACGAVLLATVLAGLFPATGAARGNLHATLIDRGAGGQRGRRRALGALVAAEFALALVLAVGAGLMIRTFANLSAENPGFEKDGVLSLRVLPPASMQDGPVHRRFWREVLDRLDAMPGVESAGAIHLLPLGTSNYVNNLLIDGRPLPDGDPPRTIDWRSVTPGYVETLRIPLVRGRLFTAAEHESDERLVLLNETAAARYFPNEDPIGRRVRTPAFENDWATVVGVVGDTKDLALATPARPQMYRLHAPFTAGMTLMVRTAGDPLALAAPIRELIRSIDAEIAVDDVQPLAQVAADSIARPRLLTALLSGFGVLALLLGAIGLYGVMAYGTVQRTREFGVRLALGARTGEVLGLVARDAIRLAGVGVGLGLAGALALTRLLASQLYGVTALDPLVFVGAALLLAAVALAAALAPALRAARTDPMAALRWE
ncbi:MAG TPA: ABC transporter permease [Gammaproteobacteria bacterium]|nr:ABC transporter permease [Gammaproteobacteria bacterium]